ncbi:MAG: DUF2480 family protein [Chitinophagia bacterium]|nr:DUF2480 family protein [Chitinophagia bacterium]
MDAIVNKVAESGIITLDLTSFLPAADEMAVFDLRPYLFRELILKEKDYRAALLATDWQQFTGKHVAVTCTADAIIPVWAYMLATTYLQAVAESVYPGDLASLEKHLILKNIQDVDASQYTGQRVVIKGCGDVAVPDYAYVAITAHLRGVVRSLMYGEPCSTVPLYKKRD